jgi:hypothetical protein
MSLFAKTLAQFFEHLSKPPPRDTVSLEVQSRRISRT